MWILGLKGLMPPLTFSSLPHSCHLVSCSLNFRSCPAVAKFGKNLELKLISPRKLCNSATLVGGLFHELCSDLFLC